MDSYEEVISALNSTIRREENYREIQKRDDDLRDEYQKKIFSAPLIGCGAGLVLFSTAIASEKVTSKISANLVPGLWCFFFGVLASFFAGAYYSRYFEFRSNMNCFRGNAQEAFLDIRDRLWKRASQLDLVEDVTPLSSTDKKQIQDILNSRSKADFDEAKSMRLLSYTRWMLLISSVLFFLGVVIPLIALTSTVQFFWEK